MQEQETDGKNISSCATCKKMCQKEAEKPKEEPELDGTVVEQKSMFGDVTSVG